MFFSLCLVLILVLVKVFYYSAFVQNGFEFELLLNVSKRVVSSFSIENRLWRNFLFDEWHNDLCSGCFCSCSIVTFDFEWLSCHLDSLGSNIFKKLILRCKFITIWLCRLAVLSKNSALLSADFLCFFVVLTVLLQI